ncbi:MAG: flavodoxin family protein [Lachnospiraceae bacterium]
MKGIIIYFSHEGFTETAARMIAKETGMDLLKLEPKKQFPSGKISKFIWGGKSAVMGDKPELTAYQFQADPYDTIILATPIWAGTVSPPMLSFLSDNRIAAKKIGLLATCAGGPSDKCFQRMKEFLPDASIIETLTIVQKKEMNLSEVNISIMNFCKKLEEA